jgi:Protein of unknown function (DUF3024)
MVGMVPEIAVARIERWCRERVPERQVWRLHWRDRDESRHEYRGLPSASSVDGLLSEIDRDPPAIFWG